MMRSRAVQEQNTPDEKDAVALSAGKIVLS